MKHSNRLLKKMHKVLLSMDIIDLSLNPQWRKRLFESKSGQIFTISVNDTLGLSERAVAAVRRYKLHFSVQKVAFAEGDSWLSEGDAVVFKFWATAYPALRRYSGNNPAVL